MKALDTLDLSHTLNEQQHKQSFLNYLNEFCEIQYRLVNHSIAEQRGILSNVIHNQIARFMLRQKHAQPLLYYPDGVVYLVEQSAALEINNGNLHQIAQDASEFPRRTNKWKVAQLY